jgi:hypothetical protein
MTTQNQAVQDWYTERLRQFHGERYQAYLDDSDPNNELHPKSQELSQAAVKLDRADLAQLPAEVRAAFDFYFHRVEQEDWGSVAVYRVQTDILETYAVRVTTDGDDGWLEVYDLQGNLLGAGRTYIELVAWAPRDEVRSQFGDNWPAALDTSKTLWKVPQAAPPEPLFQPGENVECRWQSGFIWFPAEVVLAEVQRVQVRFDDGSLEWLDPDMVRKVYAPTPPPTIPDDMKDLAAGDRIESRLWGEDNYYPASVVERRGNRVHVKYDDFDPEWTHLGLCRRPVPDAPGEAPPLAVGDRVECRWQGGSTLFARWVTQREGERILVEYEDGDQEWTTPSRCRRLIEEDDAAEGPHLAVGDRVECRWQGGDDYFPGKVSNRRGNRVLIDYDDGSREWTRPAKCRKPEAT